MDGILMSKPSSELLDSWDFFGFSSWDKIKYLGLPLTVDYNISSLCIEVINKINAKIAVWGGNCIINTCKLTLIKLVLSSLPIY